MPRIKLRSRALCCALGILAAGATTAAETYWPPITDPPTQQKHPGRWVWAELLTRDVAEAAELRRRGADRGAAAGESAGAPDHSPGTGFVDAAVNARDTPVREHTAGAKHVASRVASDAGTSTLACSMREASGFADHGRKYCEAQA